MLTLERVLVETNSISSLCELDWSAVKYFYNFVHGDYSLLDLNRQKFVNFKSNYKKQKALWRNRDSPKELEVLASKLREARNRSYVNNGELVPAPVPYVQGAWNETYPELGVYGDKLSGRYQCIKSDLVWTSDVTQLGKRWLVILMDLSTRQVIGNQLLDKSPLSTDVIKLLAATISARQRPKMFHSDSGQIYTSNNVTDFLKSEDVVISRGNQKYRKHHNQVQERLHRTLKEGVVRKLYDCMGEGDEHTRQNAWEYLNKQSLEGASLLVKEVIEKYNSTFHRGIGVGPNMCEAALATHGPEMDKLALKDSAVGEQISEIRKEVVAKYAGDWQRFFIDFYIRNLSEHKSTQAKVDKVLESARDQEHHLRTIIAKLESEKLGLKSEVSSSSEQIVMLQSRLEEMEKNVDYISKREAAREQEELEKRDRQARRRARTRKPKREALYAKEYKIAQSLIKGDNFENSRDRVCILLLYLTGLQVSSLLLTTGEHLSTLLRFLKEDQQKLVYPSTKSRPELILPLPGEAIPLIEERSNDLQRLLTGRALNDFVITRAEDSKDLISLTNLKKRLNRILIQLSGITGKVFRTHSFRAGLATSILATAGIEIARDALTLRDLNTTNNYNSHKYSQEEVSKALGFAYKAKRKKSTSSHQKTPKKV